MKRSLILTVSLSVTAALLYTSISIGQAGRGFTAKVTASTTPKRDRTRPYTFTTSGRIVPPSRPCAPGQTPSRRRNCVPTRCPRGARTADYCQRPGRARICSGKVNVRFQHRGSTISSRNVTLRSNCTYRSRVSIRIRVVTRRGVFKVRARFQGNALLRPRTAATNTVRGG